MSDFTLSGRAFHTPLMLAPMAGVTDRAFRRLCLEMGADYLTTEMVSAKAMHYRDEKTAELAYLEEREQPISVQLFGSDPAILAEAAAALCNHNYHACRSQEAPFAIDLNMGCPVKKITGNGEGSAIMKDPALAGRIVEAVVKASSVPVTVKFRTGWDDAHKNAVEFAKTVESAGASMLCVHGRTKEQMYRPGVDLETIAAVKAAVKVPVIGNGGVMTGADALEMLRVTGCDGLAVARGAEGNPWIFREIRAALSGVPYSPPDREEIVRTALRHTDLLIADKGEYQGVREARKHIAWYVRGLRGAARLRDEVNRIENETELRERLLRFMNETEGENQ